MGKKNASGHGPSAPTTTAEERLQLEANYSFTLDQICEMLALPPELKTPELQKLGGLEALADGLHTNLESGISTDEAPDFRQRRIVYGCNTYPEPPGKSWFTLFFNSFKDLILIILIVAAFISLVIAFAVPGEDKSTGWIEGAAILLAVLVVAVVTATNDKMQDNAFRKLNAEKEDRDTKVLRGGEQKTVSTHDLNVGDVVILDTGDQVPADGIFISGHNMKIDESTMTGESIPVSKSTSKPWMLSGCQVADGVGTMMVLAVGINSEWGRTLGALTTDQPDTPLQKKLERLAKNIGWLGIAVALVVFLVNMGFWTYHVVSDGFEGEAATEILDFFIISVTIVVVAVPEGLPLAVTISLAYSMKQMKKDNNFVRHLKACEIMGGATNICSDKTGTLTENRMTVVQGWLAGDVFSTVPLPNAPDSKVAKLLCEGVAVNSNACIEHNESTGLPVFVGNKTECALLKFCNELGYDYQQIRNEKSSSVVKMYTFSSARKRMSAVIPNESGSYTLYCKGASEIILERCNKVLNSSGAVSALDAGLKQELEGKITELASMGLRTLCMAYRDFASFDDYIVEDGAEEMMEPPEEEMTLIALVGIEDPLRPEVPEAVRLCNKAGITVRMVTGDNILTAKKIAADCGILTEDGFCLEGPAFRNMSEEELLPDLPRLQVLARSSPTDKLRLVRMIKDCGELVAVTGDGTNDAPALKEAHVGLSMGIMGTEVAKEASDIIILDDNFHSIVLAVVWGRSIFDNIRKFLQFQLTVNVSALTVAFVGAVTQKGIPLTAVQLLWVNLIMDTMAALALGTEKPTLELLNRPPINTSHPKARLLSNKMWKHILGQSLYQVIVLNALLWLPMLAAAPACDDSGEEDVACAHFTVIFNAFVFAQVFNEINSRKINDELNVFEGFFTNAIFVGVIVVTVIVQAAIIFVGGPAFKVVPLNPMQWAICIVIGLGSLGWGLILRLIPVPPTKQPRSTTADLLDKKDLDDDELEKTTLAMA